MLLATYNTTNQGYIHSFKIPCTRSRLWFCTSHLHFNVQSISSCNIPYFLTRSDLVHLCQQLNNEINHIIRIHHLKDNKQWYYHFLLICICIIIIQTVCMTVMFQFNHHLIINICLSILLALILCIGLFIFRIWWNDNRPFQQQYISLFIQAIETLFIQQQPSATDNTQIVIPIHQWQLLRDVKTRLYFLQCTIVFTDALIHCPRCSFSNHNASLLDHLSWNQQICHHCGLSFHIQLDRNKNRLIVSNHQDHCLRQCQSCQILLDHESFYCFNCNKETTIVTNVQ